MPNLVTNPFTAGSTTVSGTTTKGALVECRDSNGGVIGTTTASKVDGTWSISVTGNNPPFNVTAGGKEKIVVESKAIEFLGIHDVFATVRVVRQNEFIGAAEAKEYHGGSCYEWSVPVSESVTLRDNDRFTITITDSKNTTTLTSVYKNDQQASSS
jgi:hypothetical protein